MRTYTVSEVAVLQGYGSPLATIYKYSDGTTIYVLPGIVDGVGNLEEFALTDGMESKGAVIYSTQLRDSELA